MAGERHAATLMDRADERLVIDRLLNAVRAGQSRVLVLHGEAGIGKTALLRYLATRAAGCRVVRAAGVQSEMELAFAGLHQLCAPLVDWLDDVPDPQRDALRTAFGISAAPTPDRFLVGLAVLSLLSAAAEERPLVGIVDDAQWLDQASAQALGFVARRLAADPIGLVFATRVPGEEIAGLPRLEVDGLRDPDARALLDAVLAGPVDAQVRDLIIAETRANPLALLELPRGLTPEQLAGGFGLPAAVPLDGRIEDSFRRQISALPLETQQLLTLAAADPSGDLALVLRAAGWLGIGMEAAVLRPMRTWRSSALGCGSGIRWCGRRPTGRRRPSGDRRTRRWRKSRIRMPIRTGGPGTGRRPPPGQMRTWPRSWSARPGGRGRAAGWQRRPRSWNARPC
jgi:AAA ATPase domain